MNEPKGTGARYQVGITVRSASDFLNLMSLAKRDKCLTLRTDRRRHVFVFILQE
jgi:hypothetical protein